MRMKIDACVRLYLSVSLVFFFHSRKRSAGREKIPVCNACVVSACLSESLFNRFLWSHPIVIDGTRAYCVRSQFNSLAFVPHSFDFAVRLTHFIEH